MDMQQLIALVSFAFVSSVTPGPNNMMLMASGANFGIRRTLPHMAGVAIGFALMIFLVGIGLIGLFDAWPPLFAVLKFVSAAYLLWLAWKSTTIIGIGTNCGSGRSPGPPSDALALPVEARASSDAAFKRDFLDTGTPGRAHARTPLSYNRGYRVQKG